MEEVRASEVAETLEDLMYVSILEKFLLLRVEMLPRLDGERDNLRNTPMTRDGVEAQEDLEKIDFINLSYVCVWCFDVNTLNLDNRCC